MEAIKWLYFGWIWKLNCLIKTKNKKDIWIKLFEKIGSDLPQGLIQLPGGINEKIH